MLFQRIGLCMTERCSAACSICCFSCSPDRRRRLTHEALRFHIRDAAGHAEISSVGFTGGEALLYYEEVLELSRYARSLNLQTTVNTNGFWGEDPELWKPRLCALREAGLRAVFFSSDPYHQQFVPVEHLRQALELSLSLGLQTRVSVLETARSDHRGELAARLGPELSKTLQSAPLLCAGRAAEIIPRGDFPAICAPEKALCCFDSTLHVSFDGNLYLCCSQLSPEIPSLALGHAGETTLREASERMVQSDVTYLLLRRGPGWFYEQAASRGLVSGSGAVHPCRLCRDLIGNAALLDALREDICAEAEALRLESFFNGLQAHR